MRHVVVGCALALAVGCTDEQIVAAVQGYLPSGGSAETWGGVEPAVDPWAAEGAAEDDASNAYPEFDDPADAEFQQRWDTATAEGLNSAGFGAEPEPAQPGAAQPGAAQPEPAQPEPPQSRAEPQARPARRAAPARRPTPEAEPAPAVDLFALELPGQTVIAFDEVPGLIGKTVYPVKTMELRGRNVRDKAVYVGEALTLLDAKASRMNGIPTFNYTTVRKADGTEGEIQLRYLSRTPLACDLTQVTDVEALLHAVALEAVHAGLELHRHMARYDYDFPADDAIRVPASHTRNTYEDGFKYAEYLTRTLIGGSNSRTDQIMRNPITQWTILSADERVLAWFEDGIPDKAQKKRAERYRSLLSKLSAIHSYGFSLARLEDEREAKRWLRGMEDLPPAAVERMNQQKHAELDARRDQTLARQADAMARANELYAELF